MPQKKPGFMLYHDDVDALASLDDAQFGAVVRALYAYSASGDRPDTLDGITGLAFAVMAQKIDRDNTRYADICDRRKKAAEKRWGAKEVDPDFADDANACNCNDVDATSANCNCNSNSNCNSNCNSKQQI